METAEYPSWIAAVAAGVTMLSLGMRTRMFARPEFKSRCAACGRHYWRGRSCPCTRRTDSA